MGRSIPKKSNRFWLFGAPKRNVSGVQACGVSKSGKPGFGCGKTSKTGARRGAGRSVGCAACTELWGAGCGAQKRLCANNPSGNASLPDYVFFDRFARETLGDFIPQTPSLGTRIRETRIVVPQAALLAISDVPPAFIAHRARRAPVPQTPSSLRAVLSRFYITLLWKATAFPRMRRLRVSFSPPRMIGA